MSQTTEIVVRLEPSDVIDLTPADLAYATWRPRQAVARPVPAPFCLETCLARFRRVIPGRNYWAVPWDWSPCAINDTMTPAEAHFWFFALTECGRDQFPARVASTLQRKHFDGQLRRDEIIQRLRSRADFLPPLVVAPLANLLLPVELLAVLLDGHLTSLSGSVYHAILQLQTHLIDGFVRHVRPYLDADTTERLREFARTRIDPNLWTQSQPPGLEQSLSYRLAPILGLHRELLTRVSAWADGLFARNTGYLEWQTQPREIVFGLGNPYLVDQHMRRLGLKLRGAFDARLWLAHTATTALDWVMTSVRAASESASQQLLEVLCQVRAPVVAPLLLELQAEGRGCSFTRDWLRREVGNAVVGLLPQAAQRGKQAEAARSHLRDVRRRGLGEVIEKHLGTLEASAQARIREEVLVDHSIDFPEMDETSTPVWLRTAFLHMPSRPIEQIPNWLDLGDLPPLVVGGRRLAVGQVRTVLRAIMQTKANEIPPEVVLVLRQQIAIEHREAFVWRLMDQWQGMGGALSDTLALSAVGMLGGDQSAMRLATRIREWNGPSGRARASAALDALAVIGTHFALVQLASLARQLKTRQPREKARALLAKAAEQRGVSIETLEDRAVPTLGFESGEGPKYDFGPRQFQAILVAGPRLLLRDGSGALREDLPAIGARDDREMARKATADWRELKKQLRDVLKEQAHRLERTMVTGHRWPLTWLGAHLLKHPLLSLVARLVLWGAYDERRRLAVTFRINEEQSLVDADEAPVNLRDYTSVRIVHPIELSDAVRGRWAQAWSDHELMPPFAQLGRRIFPLTPQQADCKRITWFSGRRTAALTVAGLLKERDWQHAQVVEQYQPGQAHLKAFARANLTAVICHPDVGTVSYPDPQAEQEMKEAFFVRGTELAHLAIAPSAAMCLREVDVLAYSEVCEALALLQSKGKG